VFHEAGNMFMMFREGFPEGQPFSEEVIGRFKEEYKSHKENRILSRSLIYPGWIVDGYQKEKSTCLSAQPSKSTGSVVFFLLRG
jgi:hypothetical protein